MSSAIGFAAPAVHRASGLVGLGQGDRASLFKFTFSDAMLLLSVESPACSLTEVSSPLMEESLSLMEDRSLCAWQVLTRDHVFRAQSPTCTPDKA